MAASLLGNVFFCASYVFLTLLWHFNALIYHMRVIFRRSTFWSVFFVSGRYLSLYYRFFPHSSLVYNIYMRRKHRHHLINDFISFRKLKIERFVEIFVQKFAHARRQFRLSVFIDNVSERHFNGLFRVEPNRWEILNERKNDTNEVGNKKE